MLASTPSHHYYMSGTSAAHQSFLPTIPSPLSPRSANVYGGWRAQAFASMSSPSSDENSVSSKQKENVGVIPFSKRPVKKAPSPKQDELKERRRSIFLKKVKEGRDDKRFEARGEDIMRLDFMQRQRAWEAALARDAPLIPSDPPEEDDEELQGWEQMVMSSGNAMQMSSQAMVPPSPGEEVDEVLQHENEELEALLSYLPTQEDEGTTHEGHVESVWSDSEEDYDALFSEFMEHDAMVEGADATLSKNENTDHDVQVPALHQMHDYAQAEGEAMDMS